MCISGAMVWGLVLVVVVVVVVVIVVVILKKFEVGLQPIELESFLLG